MKVHTLRRRKIFEAAAAELTASLNEVRPVLVAASEALHARQATPTMWIGVEADPTSVALTELICLSKLAHGWGPISANRDPHSASVSFANSNR
jgi:hypothetical protein